MTAMAAEAGAGAVESEAGEASAAGRTESRPRRAAPARSRTARAVSKAGPEGRAASRAVSSRGQRSQPRRAARSVVPGGGTKYRSVIVGELLIALLLVASTPFARKNTAQVSPWSGQDLLQLGAITVLYFILAVVAGTGQTAARFSAWFGGLILLGIGLGETAGLVQTLAIFGGTNAQPAATTAAASNLPNKSTLNPNVGETAAVTPSADTGITSRGEQQDTVTPPSASGSGNG